MEMPEPEEFFYGRVSSEEIERIYAPSGYWIAVIAKKRDSTFTYFIYHWDLSDFEYIEEGFWNEYGGESIFDTPKRAKLNALDELRIKSGEEF